MSSSKSKSSSSNAQVSQTGDGGASAGIGASDNVQSSVSNTAGDVTQNIAIHGVQTGDVVDLFGEFGDQVGNLLAEQREGQRETTEALSNVAQAAAGAQTELGRSINKLILPAALVAGIYIVFTR
jgi:hypothetical protein